MKKISIVAVFALFALSSCKKEENSIDKPMLNPPVENSSVVPEETSDEMSFPKAPDFKYAEAREFAIEYVDFIQHYQTAVSHNDSEALKVLGPKLNEYQRRGVELMKRIPQEEAVAFQEFYMKVEQSIK